MTNGGFSVGQSNAKLTLDISGFSKNIQQAISLLDKFEGDYSKAVAEIKRANADQTRSYTETANVYQKYQLALNNSSKDARYLVAARKEILKAYKDETLAVDNYIKKLEELNGVQQQSQILKGFHVGSNQSNSFVPQFNPYENVNINSSSFLKGAPPASAYPGFAPYFQGSSGGSSGGGGGLLAGAANGFAMGGAQGALMGLGELALPLLALQQIVSILKGAVDLATNFVKPFIELNDSLKVSSGLFTGMVGSLSGSKELVKYLSDYAAKTGLGFENVLETAQKLLPALKRAGDSTQDITKYLDVARRLAVLNQGPTGGLSGASISISEAIASGGKDLRSLQQRFNLSRTMLRQFIKDANGDIIQGISNMLDKFGVTTQAANAVSNTFGAAIQRLTDSINTLGSNSIGPLLNDFIIPFINGLASGIRYLSDFAGKFAEVEEKSGPIIARLKELVALTGQFLKSPIGAGGAAIFGGATAATVGPGGNFNGSMTGAQALGEVLKVVAQRFVDFLKLLEYMMSAGTRVVDFFSQVPIAILTFNKAILTAAQVLVNTFPGLAKVLAPSINSLIKFNDQLIVGAKTAQAIAHEQVAQSDKRIAGLQGFIDGLSRGFGGGTNLPNTSPIEGDSSAAEAKSAAAQAQADYASKIRDFWQKRAEEFANFARQQGQRAADFYRAQSQRQQDFDTRIANEKADFATQEARRLEDLNREIDRINEDSAKKAEQITQSSNDKIAKIESEAAETEQKALQDHQIEMQRMKEDHEQTLKDAAARLDAAGVIRENQKYNRDKKRAEEDFARQDAQRKAELNKQIEEEKQAATKELNNLKQTDADRIAELQKNYEIEKARSEEDFATRLDRENSQFEIEQQRQAANFQIEQSRRQQEFMQKESTEMLHFQQEIQAQSTHFALMLAGQSAYYAQSRAMQNSYLGTTDTGTGGRGTTGTRDSGGDIRFNGLYSLVRGEKVLRSEDALKFNEMMAGRMPVLPFAHSTSQKHITIAPNINLHGIKDVTAVAKSLDEIVDKHLIKRLEGYLDS